MTKEIFKFEGETKLVDWKGSLSVQSWKIHVWLYEIDFLNSINNENIVHLDRKYKFATRRKWSTWHQISYLQVPSPCNISICRDTSSNLHLNRPVITYLSEWKYPFICATTTKYTIPLPTESSWQQKTNYLCNSTNGSHWTWTVVTLKKSLKWKKYSKHHVVG